jgi:hypothetical protein
MGAMRMQMSELECCPRCAGHLVETLDAAGQGCGAGVGADRDGPGGLRECGCGDACACAQADSWSSTPNG